MLDSGIARMGIFAFIFLIAFAGIISLIPNEMNSYGYQYNYGNPKDKIPDSWNGIDLTHFNFTGSWNWTITGSAFTKFFDIGGRNLGLYGSHTILDKHLTLSHRYGFLLAWDENLDWYDESHKLVSYHYGSESRIGDTQLNNAYTQFGGNITFTVLCLGLGSGSSKFNMTTLFSFNTTLYDTPTEAWDNSALKIFVGINSINSNWQRDIWNIITNLLGFNTLAIFGTSEPYALILNGVIVGIIASASIIFITAVALEILPDWL